VLRRIINVARQDPRAAKLLGDQRADIMLWICMDMAIVVVGRRSCYRA
jgi:hypothetical protein